LFEEERKIWGGMAEPGKDYSSKVLIKIEAVHAISPKEYPEKCPKKYKKLEYALFPVRTEQGDPPKKLIIPPMSFDLKIRILDASKKDEVMRSLQWWMTFGGIGARTRRGCGSVYCTDKLEQLHPVSREEAEAAGCEMIFPKEHILDDSIAAWQQAIEYLYEFRQGEKNGRKKRFGKSKWPEADAIRKKTGEWSLKHKPPVEAPILFPRAMFGMPIGFPFKSRSDNDKPSETELLPMKNGVVYDRLASPLILKVLATSKGKFRPVALLMPYFHMDDLGLNLKRKKGKTNWNFERGTWWNCSNADEAPPVKDYNGIDALTAFMNFFKNGGEKL
ncbi:MAG: hypothetical protein D3923_13475, partial [Candidatus Electrothrix sp. AR3]|nr:hypothetical protein [Candidatus Electrothrix sp. AR3]